MRTVLLLSLLVLAACSTDAGANVALRLERTIPLDGVGGRIDHLAYDPAHGRLFVAALGNDSLEVVDLEAGRRVRSLPAWQVPTGVAVVDDLDRVAVASAGQGSCRLLDGKLEPAGTVDGLPDADNVRYDATAHRLFVGYGDGALAVIDPSGPKLVTSIPLAGHPESFQLERHGRRVFVNVPTAGQVAVVDRDAGKVVDTWPVEAARANFPMALDEDAHRLFLGCRSPARLVVLDTRDGHAVTTVECCGDADDLFVDARRGRVYVAGGEGFVDVFAREPGDRLRRVARVPTASGARTARWVDALDRLFVAVPKRGARRAAILVFAAG